MRGATLAKGRQSLQRFWCNHGNSVHCHHISCFFLRPLARLQESQLFTWLFISAEFPLTPLILVYLPISWKSPSAFFSAYLQSTGWSVCLCPNKPSTCSPCRFLSSKYSPTIQYFPFSKLSGPFFFAGFCIWVFCWKHVSEFCWHNVFWF